MFAAKLGTFVPEKAFSVAAKTLIGFAFAGFFIGMFYNFFDVFRIYSNRTHTSKLRLEIKDKNGSVLATNLDPADIEKIAEVVEEAKGASK